MRECTVSDSLSSEGVQSRKKQMLRDLDRMRLSGLSDEEFRGKTRSYIENLLNEKKVNL